MADKKEQLWVAEPEYKGGDNWRVVEGEWVIASDLSKKNSKLVVALHNTALDVNESNPMAVAGNMRELINWNINFLYGDQHAGLTAKRLEGLRLILAAITKPADK